MPHSGFIHWRWGKILTANGDFERAIQIFTKGVELSPNYFLLYFQRAETYFKMEDYAKALADLETAENLSSLPGNKKSVHDMRGSIFQKQEKLPEAITEFSKSIKAVPNATIYRKLADCQKSIGQKEAAYRSISQAIELRPSNLHFRRIRGQLAWELSEYSVAVYDACLAWLLENASRWGIDLEQIDLKKLMAD